MNNKNEKRKAEGKLVLAGLVFSVLLWPRTTHAVMPPDFVFNISSQLAHFFTAFLAISSLAAIAFFRLVKTSFVYFKSSKKSWAILIMIILFVSCGATYLFYLQKQKGLNEQWRVKVEEKQQATLVTLDSDSDNSELFPISTSSIDLLRFNENGQGALMSKMQDEDVPFHFDFGEYENDEVVIFLENVISSVLDNSDDSLLLENMKKLEQMIEESPHVLVHKLVRITENHTSMEIVTGDTRQYARYGLVINTSSDKEVIGVDYTLLSKSMTPISEEKIFINVEEFDDILKNNRSDYTYLLIRTEMDNENGYLPGGTNIRLADIRAGRWVEYAQSEAVIVLCQDGFVRSYEVVNFLKSKGIKAYSLEGGITAWEKFGGEWQGSYERNAKYKEKKYQHVFETDELSELVEDGVVLIDSRKETVRKENPLAINGLSFQEMEFMYDELPTLELDKMMGELADNKRFILVCDSEKTCSKALMVGVVLDWHGNEFLGRYITPWEL